VRVFRKLYLASLGAYCVVLAWLTLRSLPYPDGSADLVPFLDTWQQMRDYGDRSALREVAGNFILFVPFGYLLQASLRRRLPITCALAACASAGIETFQALLASGRNPSIDDVIFNTIGAAAGALLFTLVRGAVRYRRETGDRATGPSAPES
jgi:glycopeptide antibiotics resistance protein